MNTAVWKTQLITADEQQIEVPAGAEMLHVAVQAGRFCIWYRCDPTAHKVYRTIRIAGTGHPISDENWRYIGSVFWQSDALIFHIFEKPEM